MSKIIRQAAARLKLVSVRHVTEDELPARSQGPRRSKSGGAYRDRTDDPLLAKQVLSQLS